MRTYSLPNIHGDVFATIDADGNVLTAQQTGPYGEQLPNQTTAWNTLNGGAFGYGRKVRVECYRKERM